jgi:hypothetical protein
MVQVKKRDERKKYWYVKIHVFKKISSMIPAMFKGKNIFVGTIILNHMLLNVSLFSPTAPYIHFPKIELEGVITFTMTII